MSGADAGTGDPEAGAPRMRLEECVNLNNAVIGDTCKPDCAVVGLEAAPPEPRSLIRCNFPASWLRGSMVGGEQERSLAAKWLDLRGVCDDIHGLSIHLAFPF